MKKQVSSFKHRFVNHKRKSLRKSSGHTHRSTLSLAIKRPTLNFVEQPQVVNDTPLQSKTRAALLKLEDGDTACTGALGTPPPHKRPRFSTSSSVLSPLSPTPSLPLLNTVGGSLGQSTPLSKFFTPTSTSGQQRRGSQMSPQSSPTISRTKTNVSSRPKSVACLSPRTPRDNIYIICVQHSLDTTATLIEKFKEKGVLSHHIYFLDKLYSTNEKSLQKISRAIDNERNIVRLQAPVRPWLYGKNMVEHIKLLYSRVIADISQTASKPDKIILLDDGGRLIQNVPQELLQYPIYGVEQTTAGHNRLTKYPPKFPWISVATSDIKRNEDPFIGQLAEQCVTRLLTKLSGKVNPREVCCGIIGLGNIGAAVAKSLNEKGYTVFFYDQDARRSLEGVQKCATVDKLVTSCKFIIGCTGKNNLKNINLKPLINENKYFISVSSEAIEFKSSMEEYENYIVQNMEEYPKNPFTNLKYKINNCDITYVNAGYPATFDPLKQHAVAPEHIAITRAALFASVMQLIYLEPSAKDKNSGIGGFEAIGLNEEAQKYISNEWHKTIQTQKDTKNIPTL